MSSFGLAPIVPLVYDEGDGPYRMITSYKKLVNQNFKMLMLTAPGERVMIPDYGVGLRNYLFENNTRSTTQGIRGRIQDQINRYMPFLQLIELRFDDTSTVSDIPHNQLNIYAEYYIRPLEEVDVIILNFDLDRNVFV